MIFKLIILLFLTGFSGNLSSFDTTLYFDIIHNDKIIGNLKATQTNKNYKTHYHSSTTIRTKIIKDIKVNYKYDVTFEDEILKKADVDISLNDRPHAETHTKWKDAEYHISKNGKKEAALNDSIAYATILLFFEEPVNVDRCYSEQNGSFNSIVALGNHSYKKINSKGRENTYYYKRGVLQSAVIDGGMVHFQMIAKE